MVHSLILPNAIEVEQQQQNSQQKLEHMIKDANTTKGKILEGDSHDHSYLD